MACAIYRFRFGRLLLFAIWQGLAKSSPHRPGSVVSRHRASWFSVTTDRLPLALGAYALSGSFDYGCPYYASTLKVATMASRGPLILAVLGEPCRMDRDVAGLAGSTTCPLPGKTLWERIAISRLPKLPAGIARPGATPGFQWGEPGRQKPIRAPVYPALERGSQEVRKNCILANMPPIRCY